LREKRCGNYAEAEKKSCENPSHDMIASCELTLIM